MAIIREFRAVVYISGVAFTKVVNWLYGEEPKVSEPCIFHFHPDGSERQLRVENVIQGELCPDGLLTYFFKLEDDDLLYHFCEPKNRGYWDELSQR